MRRRHKYKKHSSGPPIGLLLVLILLIAGAVLFITKFGLPTISSGRVNIAIYGDNLKLLSLDLKNKSAVIVSFPNDYYFSEVIHGYGQYRANAVYDVGQLDKRGGETLAGTVREQMGIPVNGFWKLPGHIDDLKKFLLAPPKIFSGLSSLNIADRANILLTLSQIRFDKIKNIDMGLLSEDVVLADGSTAKNVEKENIDNLLSSIFIDDTVRNENIRLEVVNTTSYSGLGNRAARIITNIGGSVVSVASSDSPSQGCQIEVSKSKEKSQTIQKLAKIFSCRILETDMGDRVEAKIILGSDYVNWLTK